MFGLEDSYPAPEKFVGTIDQLHALAAEQVGSSDFGSDEYLLGLRVLLESMDYDPHFSERGKRIAWGWLITTLASRARTTAALKQVPDVDKVQITRPVVITGLHRTGTTALHRLLAVDPRFQELQGWLTGAPMPRPPRETWHSNPMFQKMVEQLDARFAAVPGTRAAHDLAVEEVDECIGILCQSFVSNLWTVAWSTASYDAWYQTQSERPGYLYYRRALQLIGSSEPEKRWLLKEPSHIQKLDLVFEMFPDVRVIQTHRDPAKAIPSLCAMLMQQHPLMEVGREQQRAHYLGYRETGRSAKAIRDAEAVAQAHPGQVLDVRHEDFHRDPMGTIRRIYPFIGLDLTPEVEAAMEQRIGEAPEAAHGAHRYAASDFDLTEDEIRDQFGAYIDRFDLRPK